MSRDRYATAGLFVLLATLWGLSFVATRAAVADVPPVLLAALRFDVAGLLLLGYAAWSTRHWVPNSRADWLNVGLGGLLFVAAHHAFLFAGQQYVTSAVAAVIVSLDPILAAAFARLALPEEAISRLGAAGLVVGLVGAIVVADPDPGSLTAARSVGGFLVFLAAAAFALGAVLTRRTRTTLPVQSMQAWMMLVGAAILHVVAVAIPGQDFSAAVWTQSALVGLAYLAVVAAGVGYLIYFALLDRVGPVEVNLVGYAAPVAAAIGGWLLLDEAVTFRTIVGFGVILVGFALVKHRALRAEVSRARS
ncbi:DMT(drug/metabolite transporter) superfamily permease [Halovivax ruber XH-70]|uniref:DMT(Drug/metabolite transporter) superfamily permease n=1 Tax=Halovivax ruber (strain DSM 18193 / JCM 13892 / XH-70) TaxID=797302 RepID=L0IEY1_HALRX|nr:DMT family transporter [Halovivax ruber]AGB17299.1 DMT(drug/metabolite transporter) superfamily permease [Halovivax ruber XH-70]